LGASGRANLWFDAAEPGFSLVSFIAPLYERRDKRIPLQSLARPSGERILCAAAWRVLLNDSYLEQKKTRARLCKKPRMKVLTKWKPL
jgi:hypothetical protein